MNRSPRLRLLLWLALGIAAIAGATHAQQQQQQQQAGAPQLQQPQQQQPPQLQQPHAKPQPQPPPPPPQLHRQQQQQQQPSFVGQPQQIPSRQATPVTIETGSGAGSANANGGNQEAVTERLQAAPSMNFPFYLHSPMNPGGDLVDEPNVAKIYVTPEVDESGIVEATSGPRTQRQNKLTKGSDFRKLRGYPKYTASSRARLLGSSNQNNTFEQAASLIQTNELSPPPTGSNTPNQCLYDKSYFSKLDECLARKPYPTVGLPAFKNEDLLMKRGLTDRSGCVFLLTNGLFKSYQVSKFQVESDSQCLDGNKVTIAMAFNNVSNSYLWTLRCLNRADQLLDDATLDGITTAGSKKTDEKLNGQNGQGSMGSSPSDSSPGTSICVGSSQNFGFTSLQFNDLEAQVELATDVYKNWRITNVTVAMLSGSNSANQPLIARSRAAMAAAVNDIIGGSSGTSDTPTDNSADGLIGSQSTNIKDFVFESLDGDELNWRYLHLYQNWSRNRMHANFVEQFRRFLWISLQKCLTESSDHLPIKLMDVFANQKYN